MKFATLIVLLLTTATALAQDKPAKEPAALVKLRKAYEAKVKAVVEPVTAAYLKKLDEMKKEFGAKGDLESAQAVQKEIESMATATKAKTAVTIVGKWTWNQMTVEFHKDGTASESNGTQGKWTCVDKKTRKYQASFLAGRYVVWMVLSKDGTSFVAKNSDNQSWTSEKLPTDEQK